MQIRINYIDNTRLPFEGIDLPGFCGSFGTRESRNANHVIYELDAFDEGFVKNVELREDEKIFRCDTELCRRHGMKYLVKINFKRCLVYFLSEAGQAADKPWFEKKGVQLDYLNIFKKSSKNLA